MTSWSFSTTSASTSMSHAIVSGASGWWSTSATSVDGVPPSDSCQCFAETLRRHDRAH